MSENVGTEQPTPPGGKASATTDRNPSVSTLTFADDAATEGAATLSELQGQRCPNCSVGVLYVTRYDPEASHEQGDNRKIITEDPTGGAYEVNCFYCHFHESRILPRETDEQRQQREEEAQEREVSRRDWRR